MAEGPIAVIGGTGPQGRGLAYKFALAGRPVLVGSRVAERAANTAAELREMLPPTASVGGAGNAEAAERAAIVVLAVPYEGHAELVGRLDGLAGKIVVSCVNPIGFDAAGPFGLDVPEGSAAEQAAGLLPDSRVVAAFHHLAARKLLSPQPCGAETILVCGDDKEAKSVVCDLAATVTGSPGVDAGPLRCARYLEPLTAVLINVNKNYKVRSGIAVTGL